MFMDAHEFKEFLEAPEKISTNILTDRLKKLTSLGVLNCICHPKSKTRKIYYLTEIGIDMLPLMIELILWASRNIDEVTEECKEKLDYVIKDKSKYLSETSQSIRTWNTENIGENWQLD